jgi:hypothetical protein
VSFFWRFFAKRLCVTQRAVVGSLHNSDRSDWQGCLLSAIIFLIVLDEVLRRSLDGRRRGIGGDSPNIFRNLSMQTILCYCRGHTLGKSPNEICHSVLEWNPLGKRSRGRSKATWRRTVLAESGKKSFGELRAQARNRHRWRLKTRTDDLCSNGVWL